MDTASKKDKNLFRLGLAFFSLTVAVFVIQLVAGVAVSLLAPEFYEGRYFNWILSVVPLYAVGLPLCMAILEKKPQDETCRTKMSFPKLLLALVIAIGLTVLGNLISNLLMYFCFGGENSSVTNPVNELFSDADIIMAFISTVIIAPIGEEFLFRRLIIDRTAKYGELFAVVLSALMFGIYHMNFFQFFYAFFIGLLFGYIYIKKRYLRYTVILHALVNFFGAILPTLLLELTSLDFEITESLSPEQMIAVIISFVVMLLYLLVDYGCLVATIVLFFIYFKRVSFDEGTEKARVFRSPFLLLFFVFCLAMSIVQLLL